MVPPTGLDFSLVICSRGRRSEDRHVFPRTSDGAAVQGESAKARTTRRRFNRWEWEPLIFLLPIFTVVFAAFSYVVLDALGTVVVGVGLLLVLALLVGLGVFRG